MGGLYLLKGIAGDRTRVARGAFREVVPVHRLAYTFGWEGGQEVPPGSSLVEIDLIDRDGGTLLRMTHVWSGRALQENFVELAVSGLASMYPASDWSACSWPSWISARVRSH